MPVAYFDAIAPRMAMLNYLIGTPDVDSFSRQLRLWIDPIENSYDGPSCWHGREEPKTGDPTGTVYTYLQPIWTFDLSSLPKDAQITKTELMVYVDAVYDTGNRARLTIRLYPAYLFNTLDPPTYWEPRLLPGNIGFERSFINTTVGWHTLNLRGSHPGGEGLAFLGEVDHAALASGQATVILVPTEQVFVGGLERAYRRIRNDYGGSRPRLAVTYTVPDPLNVVSTFFLDGSLFVQYTEQRALPGPNIVQKTYTGTLEGFLQLSYTQLIRTIVNKYVDTTLEGTLVVISTVITEKYKTVETTLEGSLSVIVLTTVPGSGILYYIASPSLLEFDIYNDGEDTAWIYDTLDTGVDVDCILTDAGRGIGGPMEVGVDFTNVDVLIGTQELILSGYIRADLRYRVIVRGR